MQSRRAAKYIVAAQQACSPSTWLKIVKGAVEDAEHEKAGVRSDARKFLAKILIPQDPVVFLQAFTPDHSLDELRGMLAEMQDIRNRMKGMAPPVSVQDVEDESGDSPGV
jgi:hypothetical protein